ncbi:MAG TPA: phage virion morphogenesis protein [Deltaproteobacteria bacterium]|nr:phage virion morphogenesis protein [Deltaproteobacteria bacterium]
MYIEIEPKGLEGVQRMLSRLQAGFSDLTPVMREIGEELLANWQQEWREEKDPYGEPWKPLKASTLARRRKGKGFGPVAKILRDTGRLQNSFVVEANKDRVTIGTNVFYAPFHQFGTKYIPQRRLLPDADLPDEDKSVVMEILKEYLWRLSNE